MNELTLRIDDASLLPSLRRVLNSIEGVHIVSTPRRRKTGMELAMEDEAAGRVTEWESAEQMFNTLMTQ